MLVLHHNELLPALTSVSFCSHAHGLRFLTGYLAVALLLKRGTKAAV